MRSDVEDVAKDSHFLYVLLETFGLAKISVTAEHHVAVGLTEVPSSRPSGRHHQAKTAGYADRADRTAATGLRRPDRRGDGATPTGRTAGTGLR